VEGDEVWEAVDQDRSYRTFATVPIRTGQTVHGILTLNAPSPRDLAKEDVGVMQVIASLLATAFVLGSPPRARRR
jgi:GAF domain-containing protein